MKKIILSMLFLFMAMAMAISPAQSGFWGFGRYSEKLSKAIDRELGRMEKGLDKSLEGTNPTNVFTSRSAHTSWFLNRLRVRIQPYVTFKVPVLAKLKIFPILEMHFVQKNPLGWEDVK